MHPYEYLTSKFKLLFKLKTLYWPHNVLPQILALVQNKANGSPSRNILCLKGSTFLCFKHRYTNFLASAEILPSTSSVEEVSWTGWCWEPEPTFDYRCQGCTERMCIQWGQMILWSEGTSEKQPERQTFMTEYYLCVLNS